MGSAAGKGYLLEFHQAGQVMRVNAIDPLTGTEVTTVGSVRASQADLERVAVRKLEYVLSRERGEEVRAPEHIRPGRLV